MAHNLQLGLKRNETMQRDERLLMEEWERNIYFVGRRIINV